jgi:hypothetical protein
MLDAKAASNVGWGTGVTRIDAIEKLVDRKDFGAGLRAGEQTSSTRRLH